MSEYVVHSRRGEPALRVPSLAAAKRAQQILRGRITGPDGELVDEGEAAA